MFVVVWLALLLAALVLLKYFLDTNKLKNFPPGPPRWPVVGSLPSTPGELIHLHAERHWRPRYGPLVGLNAGGQPMVIVCGAEEVFAVLRHEDCQARPTLFTQRSFGKRLGVMMTDGPYWTEHRRFTLRELRDLGLGKATLEGVVLDEVDTTVAAMLRDGPMLEPNKLFHAPVLNVLWWMVSGQPFSRGAGAGLDPRSTRLLDIMNRIMRNKRLGTAPCDIWPFLKYVAPGLSAYNEIYGPVRELQDYLRDELKAQRQRGTTDSLIGRYTEEMGKAKASSSFSDEGLIVTCFDLFLAGGESTANTLSFALLYLALYPDVQARLHEQLDALGVGADRLVSLSDKASLPLVVATLSEVMRINTIGPLTVPHCNAKEIELNGYTIPKDTVLMVSLWSVLNDKEHWGDPEAFRPDRFLSADGEFVNDPWMIQFGLGKRLCIGEHFAMHVAFLFFANLLNRFTFSLPPGSAPPSTVPEAGFTVSPQSFRVVATPRAGSKASRQ